MVPDDVQLKNCVPDRRREMTGPSNVARRPCYLWPMHGDHDQRVPQLARVPTFLVAIKSGRSVGISPFLRRLGYARRPGATTYPGRLRVLVAYPSEMASDGSCAHALAVRDRPQLKLQDLCDRSRAQLD